MKRIKEEEWLIITNFSEQTEKIAWDDCEVNSQNIHIIIANYEAPLIDDEIIEVRPYEAFVLRIYK